MKNPSSFSNAWSACYSVCHTDPVSGSINVGLLITKDQLVQNKCYCSVNILSSCFKIGSSYSRYSSSDLNLSRKPGITFSPCLW